MFYTVYKITNTINNKVYIGKHQTKDLNDGYMGSGKLLKLAIEKYGIKNFTKEILYVFNSEDEMNAKEAELVNESFVNSDMSYNLCHGGHGGFSYINNSKDIKAQSNKTRHKNNPNILSKAGQKGGKESIKKHGMPKALVEAAKTSFLGKSHTEEHKEYMSKIMKKKSKGIHNSQYGTMWITNGSENRKIKKVDIIPEGWYNGRIMKG